MKRILIVDDHRMARQTLRLLLEARGYCIEEAENGQDACTKLTQNSSFDLVISDNQMPVMTGMEFIQHLASQSYLSTHPVILYSGNLTAELEHEARQLGVFAVLSKPYKINELLEIVQQACSPPSRPK